MTNTRIRVLRLCRTRYISYTVVSDIEGATVLFDNEDVGTIQNGSFTIRIKEEEDTGNHTVLLQNGTLKQKENSYQFEYSQIKNLPNVGASGVNISEYFDVTSNKTSYTPKYPEQLSVTKETRTVTMNTEYDESTSSIPFSPTTFDFETNHTLEDNVVDIKITQYESNNELTLKGVQDAGIRYSYTINYNVDGATVKTGDETLGTITSGKLVFYKWNSEAAESYPLTFSGTLPANPATTYNFSCNPTSLSFTDKGEAKSVTVTSEKITHTNSHATGITVAKNNSVTAQYKTTDSKTNPTYTRANSGTGLNGTGTSIVFAANPDKQQRTGTVTFTQAESNKKATVNCTQAAKVSYTYTINSNCNGGTVKFNGVSKGTISGGKLVFEDDAASGTVSITGGVPATTQEFVRNDTSTDYDFSSPTTDFSWGESGGSKSVSVDSSKKITTTPVYKDKSYSAPANKTVNGDTSVTMNYTGPNYSSEYNGSPQEGDWTRVSTSWEYDDPSWISKSKSNDGTYKTKWTFNCDSNGSSARSDYDNLVQAETGDKIRFNFSQSAYVPPAPTYQFKWKPTTSTTLTETEDKFLANGKTYGKHPNMPYIQNPFYSKKNGSKYTSVNVVTASNGASGSVGSFGGSGDLDLRVTMSKNTSKAKRTGKVDIKQSNGSSTTLRMTVEQTYIYFKITESVEDQYNHTFPAGGSQFGGDHALNIWPPLQEYGAPSQYWPTAKITSSLPSWLTVNRTTGIKNGTQLIFQCSKNTNTGNRNFQVVLEEDHCGVRRYINFKQGFVELNAGYTGTVQLKRNTNHKLTILCRDTGTGNNLNGKLTIPDNQALLFNGVIVNSGQGSKTVTGGNTYTLRSNQPISSSVIKLTEPGTGRTTSFTIKWIQ